MKPLPIGVAGGVALAALLIPATTAAVARFSALQEAAAAAKGMAEQPGTSPLPPGQMIAASNAAGARAMLTASLREQAVSAGVLLESVKPVDSPGLARVAVHLSGSEAAVLGLADRIERGTPLMRFTRWRVEGIGNGVRLTAEVAAPWG